MVKPRVIIADSDLIYIVPLQLKFIEDYFDKVEIEIITEKKYFDELFSTPQKAAILVVSEEMYDASIKRHNIGNLFIMTEQADEDQTKEPNINHIFKYTSINEIITEIIGKSLDSLNIYKKEDKETQVILVYSANGGTGKTSVSFGLSSCLTKNNKNILYINAENLQTFHFFLENKTPIIDMDVYNRLINPEESLYSDIKGVIRKEFFNYLPPFKAAVMSLNLKYSVYEKIILSAKKSNDFDYIVIDTDATFDEDKARLFSIADKVIVVTHQKRYSVFSTNLLVSNLNGVNTGKYIFVCNDFSPVTGTDINDTEIVANYSINEYIHRFDGDQVGTEYLGKDKGIQRLAFLIM